MVENKARKLFHGEEKYNCAQAVLKTFEDIYPFTDECLREFKALGGGRAEGGMCGALYAAQHVVQDEAKAVALGARFKEIIGAVGCKEIKRVHGVPCHDCVAVAARLVADVVDKKE